MFFSYTVFFNTMSEGVVIRSGKAKRHEKHFQREEMLLKWVPCCSERVSCDSVMVYYDPSIPCNEACALAWLVYHRRGYNS